MTYELIESDDSNFPGHLIVDTDTGEILEAAPGIDRLAFLARQHAYAKTAIAAWERKLATIDAVLLAQQEAPRAIYGDLVCSLRDRVVKDVDVAAIREEIDAAELHAFELRELLRAVKSFDLKAVPPWAEGMFFDAHVVERRSKPWVETSITLREPKPVRAVEREAVGA